MKSPTPGYDYSRAGVLAVTLKCREGIWLCRITQTSYTLLPIGKAVREQLLGISKYYPQIKIGQYQIMPDHVHVMVHVVKDLPEKVTVRKVFRGMKVGVNRLCSERLTGFTAPVFEEGLFDRPILNAKMLAQEVAYIRDNVRKYREKKRNPKLFLIPRVVTRDRLDAFGKLWTLGNIALVDASHLVYLQFSRSLTDADWPGVELMLKEKIKQRAVFVSPFISPFERRALETIIQLGGRLIYVTSDFFDERYKPHGKLFDAFCKNRVLLVSVSEWLGRDVRLDWKVCAQFRAVARAIARQ